MTRESGGLCEVRGAIWEVDGSGRHISRIERSRGSLAAMGKAASAVCLARLGWLLSAPLQRVMLAICPHFLRTAPVVFGRVAG